MLSSSSSSSSLTSSFFFLSLFNSLPKELLRVTPEDDPDYKSLVTAQQQIESVTSYINEGKRTAENQQKIVDIQNSVEGVGVILIIFDNNNTHF